MSEIDKQRRKEQLIKSIAEELGYKRRLRKEARQNDYQQRNLSQP
jgi:hypothetical protein